MPRYEDLARIMAEAGLGPGTIQSTVDCLKNRHFVPPSLLDDPTIQGVLTMELTSQAPFNINERGKAGRIMVPLIIALLGIR
jgi:hypothetical protein